jgi:hypothetical protein
VKDRVVTLACALGALVLVYALFLPKPVPEEEEASRPTTNEHRDNGYLGIASWLEKAGVRVVKLRRRFDDLHAPALELARTGNLLVTTLPYRFGVRNNEISPLYEWVGEGNTLLVMAALGDTPDWAFSESSTLMNDLETLTGINFVSTSQPADGKKKESETPAAEDESGTDGIDSLIAFKKPKRMRLVPNRPHPLFDGVKSVVAETEYPADDWRAMVPPNGFVFALAHEEPSGSEAIWLRRFGEGTIIVSTYASLFTNQIVPEGDNARLLSNIVRHATRGKGAVIFDDTHQGMTELYDPQAFFSDPRLHVTLWLALALWFIWVVGATRLRPARAPVPAPRESALTSAVGGYLARVLPPVKAGLRICELFFNDVHRRLGQPEDGSAPWEWLERQPRVVAADIAQLREYHARLQAGRRVDLRRVHDLAVKLREQLQ